MNLYTALNGAFNQYEIYFYNVLDNNCSFGYEEITEAPGLFDIQDEFTLDIYFKYADAASLGGLAAGRPGTQVIIDGDPVTDIQHVAVVLIHEVGHCLGLYHIGAEIPETDCVESAPNSCASGGSSCHCCGDYVCDTDFIIGSGIMVNSNCTASTSPLGVDPAIFTNYMSKTVPRTCMDHFTPGQAKRMWAVLANSQLLQAMVNFVDDDGVLDGGVYSNILVESGTTLQINSPIEMLPGTYIYVEKGGELSVNSVIIGACNEMWQGVILEGSGSLVPQTQANHGKVTVTANGIIEHAKVGINAEEIDFASGNQAPASGGGIVNVWNGTLQNNEIGIRFGPYAYGSDVNVSRLLATKFSVTDDYRGNSQPVMVQAEGVRQLRIIYGLFKDLRTTCTAPTGNNQPSSRAIGVELLNASASFTGGGIFEDLDVGIWADQINDVNGAFSIVGADFKNCYKSIFTNESSGFSIVNNDFIVEKPGPCPSSTVQVAGVHILGPTEGFTFKENTFDYDGPYFPSETTIGSHAQNTGIGLNNTIQENTYVDMYIGALNQQENGDDDEGLLYLCNSFSNEFGISNPGAGQSTDIEVWSGGSVKSVQGVILSPNQTDPTGNVFSNSGFTFYNATSNTEVDYHFFDDDVNAEFENPNVGGGSNNIKDEDEDVSGCSTGTPPCDPPCNYGIVGGWQSDFYQSKSDWQAKLDNLINVTDSLQMEAEKDTIRFHRQAMNESARKLLQQYSLDTNAVEVDSITAWLERTETYQTDMHLARHHFFTGDLASFDVLYPQIQYRYQLSNTQQSDYEELDLIYDLVRPFVQATGTINGLDQTTLDSLDFWSEWCAAPGYLTQSILRRNGVQAVSDCSLGISSRSTDILGDRKEIISSPLNIFPNPANESLTIQFEKPSSDKRLIQFFNLQGQMVFQTKIGRGLKESMSIAGLPEGFYLVTVGDKHFVQQGKIFIQH